MKRNLLVFSLIVIVLATGYSFGQSAKATQQLDAVLKAYKAANLFNGSVLVAQKGKVVLKKGYGLANMEWNIPNSPDTKFRVGSITKQFTAMLIMQLKQAGKLKLDWKITDYLPWYRQDTGGKITIHHLLTHTSGLPNYTDFPNFQNEISIQNLQPKELALKYCSGNLEFQPGTKHSYSNSGYFFLGLIIEAITNKPYAQVLQEQVFDVVGMKNSGVDEPNKVVKNRAIGYEFTFEGFANSDYINMASSTYAAGAIYSTVEDLYLWDRALYGEKLLSEENKKIMFTPFLDTYAYGWIVRKQTNFLGLKKQVTTIAHGGGINGFSSMIGRIPEEDTFVVLLDNTRAGTRGGQLDAVTDDVFMTLYGLPTKPAKPLAIYEMYQKIKTGRIEDNIAYYQELKAKHKDKYNFSTAENDLKNLGYWLAEKGRIKDTIVIFKLIIDENATSSYAYYRYAMALLKDGQNELAIKNFKRSLELDPKNLDSALELKKLEPAK